MNFLRFSTLFFLTGCIFCLQNTEAQTGTAICKNLSGQSYAIKGSNIEGATDSAKGINFNYSWDVKSGKAKIITQHSKMAGSAPLSYDAIVIPVTERQLSFFVAFEQAVEIHSLYLDSKVLFYSSHKDLYPLFKIPHAAVGKVMHGKCDISTLK